MKNIFLLQEIIDDLIDTDKSLAKPLMKLLYFAKRIKNKELEEFVNNELNGYKDTISNDENYLDKIPDYRKTIATINMNGQCGAYSHNLEFPISMLPSQLSFLKYFIVDNGIVQIEELIKQSQSQDGNIGSVLSMEVLPYFQEPANKLYKNSFRLKLIITQVTTSCSSNFIIGIPSNIRKKLLDFIMNIAEQFGYDIEIETFNKEPENNKIIIEKMNNVINNTGDGNTINMGNNNHNENNISIHKGNIERLQQELSKLGLEQEDINEISEIVKSEPLDEKKELGERAKKWLHKIFGKVINGIGNISEGVSVELLTKLITEYHI